ncbi:MAG: M20 family peptidase [Burkholderiales bacterium]
MSPKEAGVKLIRRFLFVIGAGLLVLIVVIGAKTTFTRSKQLSVEPVKPVAIDGPAAAERLSAAVRFRTISSQSDPGANGDQFDALHAHLRKSFPKLHEVLKVEPVGKHALLYTWHGSDANAKPIALMAHQDVVPIAPGTEGDWQQPPFSGAIAGGFIWGRGAWDDKGNLMSIMEAIEMLVSSGFQPRQTIYLSFGADEEVGGADGAQRVVKLFKERGVKLDFVIDEGMLIVKGVLPGIEAPIAVVGVAEKGILTVKLDASATPGHSSMPPPEPGKSAIGMMSLALTRLEASPMPGSISGVARDTLVAVAPEMSVPYRVLMTNLWLFSPVVEREFAKVASTNALIRTTTALTIFNAGNKENVLPGRANATVNFRLLPGDSSDAVVQHSQQVIGNPGVKIEKEAGFSEASAVSSTDASGYTTINRTLRQLHPDVVVAPGLMLGATDSRHFGEVADSVYRFSPVRAGPEDLARFHGTNERISVANFTELIQFYHQLIQNASASSKP